MRGSHKDRVDPAQVQQSLRSLAVPFEANSGQFDERVAFMAKTCAGAVYVTRQGQIVCSLPASAHAAKDGMGGWSLRETLMGAQALKPEGARVTPSTVSRFIGLNSYQGAAYQSVQLGQAWPGIGLELVARGSNVEKLFHVAPHADARQIRVQLDGAQALRLGERGELIATTGYGEVADTAPAAFQRINGQRVDVPVQYALNSTGTGYYRFALAAYDATQPLTIDPLLQSTYLAGSSSDQIYAMAMDSATGDMLVASSTASSNFPVQLVAHRPAMVTAPMPLSPACRGI